MATGFILSINASSRLNDTLQMIADRVQVVHRRYATLEPLLAASHRDAAGCAVFEDTSDGTGSEEFCDALERHKILRPSVMIVHHGRLETAVRAVRCGAVAVHPPTVRSEDLEESVREALAISAVARENERRVRGVAQQLDRLSEGELWVLRLVLDGQLNKRIASKLEISERTVEARRKRIFEKTQTDSVAELVRQIVETVGVNDILLRCGEPLKQPPPPHWNRTVDLVRSVYPQRSSSSTNRGS